MIAVLAAAPEISLHTAVKYVAGAYAVFVVLLLVYLAIMARRLRSTERDLVELRRDLEDRAAQDRASDGARESEVEHAA